MLAFATLGSLAGASILYSIGRWTGERRIGDWLDRYGKWLLLSRDDLYCSRLWFYKHGNTAVLVARVIPGMRSISSIPAGFSLMPYPRFALFSNIGSAMWDGALIGAGQHPGQELGPGKRLDRPFWADSLRFHRVAADGFRHPALWSSSDQPPTNPRRYLHRQVPGSRTFP